MGTPTLGVLFLVSRKLGVTLVSKTVFTVGGSKEASLYFDDVIPLMLIVDAADEYGWDEISTTSKQLDMAKLMEIRFLFDRLFPKEIQKGSDNFKSWLDVNKSILDALLEAARRPKTSKMPLAEVFGRCVPGFKDEIIRFVDELGIEDAAYSSALSFVSKSNSMTDDIGMTISNLNLIDISKVTLEQILEFREDLESKAKLRRLRLFAYKNYTGKSKSYIEDDLLLRIDEYEHEAKKWGFETKEAAITTLFNSKVIMGTLCGSLIAALTGSPITSLSTLAIGALVEFGRIQLVVSRCKFKARSVLRTNPVSYIKEANKALNT